MENFEIFRTKQIARAAMKKVLQKNEIKEEIFVFLQKLREFFQKYIEYQLSCQYRIEIFCTYSFEFIQRCKKIVYIYPE